jgi:hypothetical protein
MAGAQQDVMSSRLISLANHEDWKTALSHVPHGAAHTHWYNTALAASVEDEIVLFDYSNGEDQACCPLALRRYGKSIDIATPYGFGGFATQGPCKRLPDEFRRFAIEQDWVCGYLALHPLFPHPFIATEGLEPGRTIYVLDLSTSEDFLLSSMHKTHRYELRRDSELVESIILEGDLLSEALPGLYAATLARVGASDTYRFSEATLKAWLSSPGCLALGLGVPPRAVMLCLYTEEIADYCISASTKQGRSYTRILLWAAARELKRRGVRYFNLGGGAHDADTLEAFKRRFGGESLSVPVLKQVYMRGQFMALCRQAEAVDRAGYFPPYRSP